MLFEHVKKTCGKQSIRSHLTTVVSVSVQNLKNRRHTVGMLWFCGENGWIAVLSTFL